MYFEAIIHLAGCLSLLYNMWFVCRSNRCFFADEKQIHQCNFKHIFLQIATKSLAQWHSSSLIYCFDTFSVLQCFPDCELKSELHSGSDSECQCISHDLHMKSIADSFTEGQFYMVARYLSIELFFSKHHISFQCGIMQLDVSRNAEDQSLAAWTIHDMQIVW